MPILLAGSRCRTARCCGARTRTGGQSCAGRPTDLYVASFRRPVAEAADRSRSEPAVSVLLIATSVDATALPQKTGGVLKMYIWDNPPSVSMLEGANPI